MARVPGPDEPRERGQPEPVRRLLDMAHMPVVFQEGDERTGLVGMARLPMLVELPGSYEGDAVWVNPAMVKTLYQIGMVTHVYWGQGETARVALPVAEVGRRLGFLMVAYEPGEEAEGDG